MRRGEAFAPDSEGNMTAVAHKEAHAKLILELADLLRKCWLADVELVRRPAEVKLIGHHYEVAHQAQVEVHAHPPARPVAWPERTRTVVGSANLSHA